MGTVIFGSGFVIAFCLVGAGYTIVGGLSMLVVALACAIEYLYVPMPATAEEKFQRQKFLAGLRLRNLWKKLQVWRGKEHEMQIVRGNIYPEITSNPPDLGISTEDTAIEGVPVRIYRPADMRDVERLPGVIYLHGGGFCSDEFGYYDVMIRRMFKLRRMIFVYVRYRLAPEFPFPAAVDDCFAVTRYVQRNTEELNMDSEKLVLMGDGAGANLTMNMLTRMITEAVPDLPKFKVQIALVPFIQALSFMTPSYQIYDNHKAPTFPNAEFMLKFLITYALGFATLDNSEIGKLLENAHWTDEIRKSYYPKLVSSDVLPKSLEKPTIKKTMSKITDSGLARKLNDKFPNPLFSPLFADDEILKKLPKTYILSTEIDCIRDDAFFLADRLRKLDVDVTHRHWSGMDHPFLFLEFYKNSFKALKEIVTYLDKNL
ncbi:arylacetamide deacetylase-like [Saccostrea echinata]|uniref:arylacetamide deacetylase-like n=1 Tax=Saccostrea echinata TaxID=191078 RepID=UPI002A825647|nr:arylacetamide deacetylase-like [Saccostrea echinata]